MFECNYTVYISRFWTKKGKNRFKQILISVPDPDANPDPDPPDPHVFGPPGSFYHIAKLVRKTLVPTVL